MPRAEQPDARDGASGTHCHTGSEISLGMALSPEETAGVCDDSIRIGRSSQQGRWDAVWKLILEKPERISIRL